MDIIMEVGRESEYTEFLSMFLYLLKIIHLPPFSLVTWDIVPQVIRKLAGHLGRNIFSNFVILSFLVNFVHFSEFIKKSYILF